MSRSKFAKFWLTASLLVTAAIVSTPSQAVPAFARQLGKACSTCHFQNFPQLNDYGRAFKENGYTEIANNSDVKGDNLSIPKSINAAFMINARYDKQGGDSSTAGQWTLPSDTSLFVGGRVTKNVGFISEIALVGTAGVVGFKMPFVFEVADNTKVLLVPFVTDSQGPAHSFETLNTGAIEVHLNWDHKEAASAAQYIGAGTAATGLGIVLTRPEFYVNITKWQPTFGISGTLSGASTQGNGKAPTSNYVRGVFFVPGVPGWDLAAGFQSWSGSSNYIGNVGSTGATSSDPADVDTKAWAIDGQAQGTVMGSLPLGVYLSHASAAKSSGALPNLFNLSTTNDVSATTIAASLGVLPGHLSIKAAFRHASDGNGVSDNASSIGANYLYAQNVRFMLEYTKYQQSGDNIVNSVNTAGYATAPGTDVTSGPVNDGFSDAARGSKLTFRMTALM